MTFAIFQSENFEKIFFPWHCLICEDHWLFFRLAKIFNFFVVASHQRIFEIFEKVEFLHDHEELDIGNGTVIFSERFSFRKANNLFNLTQFKIIDFLTSADFS